MASLTGSHRQGVTNASITPLSANGAARPSATTMPDRPAAPTPGSASSAGPGAIRPRRSAGPPRGDEDAGQLQQTVDGDQPKKTSARPLSVMTPPVTPALSAVDHSSSRVGKISTPPARQIALTKALFVHTPTAKSCGGACE